ncbi:MULTISPECIES: cytochrome ubiquinol oxidase subunit I [unclassified Undibacterium]|uniref:cytochrome ubiquinol oxidase subunit I n=2 Tax=Pseudomonadota TaxID=1224 RepID=UPI002AC9A6F1|nr:MULTISPECIES: cytochrome ubiquinol oxidase subunit I [unclassified Undibacterium]MEB0137607.1 cytochrome ubiquinol oxidase subunit I [Undibacterium sp. CCC2.1]MEB0170608.1 cytochrome ubiquinol oxidase subunit I [Undibacterium sp. CCC1.1]MEB0174549.1 cytochrome ubiquinol oxidase subunit I [Undibacterium sp. CCC3.4]MEB0213654.1 cytochrome ubiquinol oxidase subunit I [Undibacterium sp. 5I2]WPX43820.1 cytochrome ubiquinol oxidase subunit I [Undibacterium sp. CCC3.4]
MFGFSALELSRIQFGFTISFHIIFPAITVGLASFLTVLEFRWLQTGKAVYLDLYHYWIKIFSVNFGMGVVSGLVMAYEFGTNWGGFSTFAGGVTGPLLAYEVLTAFFLEAGFLGVMLFGWERVGRGLHFFATAMVSLGTLISTTWILASNSWMQTPQGYAIVNGSVVPTDWLKVILNPSFPYRLLHMSTAAFLATALIVAAAAAWHLLRKNDSPAVRKMLSMAMWMLVIVAPIQVLIGDAHGLNTLAYQPAKLAAIEAHWENHGDEAVPLILFAWPDMAAEKNHYEVAIPRIGSLILTHTMKGQIPGLKEFAKAERPNSTIVFFSFRIMVALGLAMIVLGLWGVYLRMRKTMYQSRYFLRATLMMGPAGLMAILAGWFTTEIGRQPWVVYGLMRTADAVSSHAAAPLAFTLALFIIVYFSVFGTGTAYLLRLMRKGPQPYDDQRHHISGGPGHSHTAARPLSAADDDVAVHLSSSNERS